MRVGDFFWVVKVTMEGFKIPGDDIVSMGVSPPVERRFTFTDEETARECRRKALAAGLRARINKTQAQASEAEAEFA